VSEPSRKAKDQIGKRVTYSKETFCKYCQSEYTHPQALKYHIVMDHWGSTRQAKYEEEEAHVAKRREEREHMTRGIE